MARLTFDISMYWFVTYLTQQTGTRVMWIPTEDEAVEMFARYFEARHRSGSIRKADETASDLKAKGDEKGHRVWTKVSHKISQLRQHDRIASRRQAERPTQ